MKSGDTRQTIASHAKSNSFKVSLSTFSEDVMHSLQSWDPRETLSLAYLITESNIKAYILPVVLFVMCSISSGGLTTNTHPSWQEIVYAFPRVVLYLWLALLHFDCSNQKDPKSVEEDRINKPWRAIPSGRLSIKGANTWYIVATCLLIAVSGLWLGGFPEVFALMAETYVYDYASGASSPWGKNLINALFYFTGQLAGVRVATLSMTAASVTRTAYEWCLLLGLCTFTTVQIQDLRDQEGDRKRGRNTMPLAMGERITRWITAVSIWFWSIACPVYWSHGTLTACCVLPLLVGFFVGARVLIWEDVKADRKSFHMYTLLWLPSLYLIPFLSKYRLLDAW